MRNLSAGIDNSILGNIKYRNNVVTGEVAVDNGNNTYDCYIAGADAAYPNIPTIFKDPVFEVGDAVEILIEYGHKELPVIIGYSKKIVQEIVDVDMNVLVTTLDAYSITPTTAYLEGRIEDIEGYENCTRRGFYYGTTTGYGSDIYTTGSFAVGAYNKQVTGLNGETTYHYQAYVHDADNDIQTGGDKSMTTTYLKNIYVVYKKTSDSKYYLVKINSDDSVTAIAELAELATGTSAMLVRILTDNAGNVYALKETENGTYAHTWYKYNSSGVLQTTKVLGASEMFGFIYGGYLYTMDFNGDEINKRNLTDLETAETINLTSGHKFYYLCFDSDGYLYTYDRDYTGEAAFIKWGVGTGISDYHQQALGSLSAWADFALLGTTIAHDHFGIGIAGTLATSLVSDMATWTMDDIPDGQVCGVANNTAYWYVLGENTADNALVAEKYNSSKVLQTTITVSSDYITGATRIYYNAITAYPF